MSFLAALGALAFLAAAVLGLVAPARVAAVRVLAGLGAAALVPSFEAAASWPALAAALAAAAIASPLPCLLASAAAFATSLRSLAEVPAELTGPWGGALATAAAVVALAGLEAAFRARLRAGADPARAGLVAGGLLVALLLALGKGSLLRWSLAIGDGAPGLTLRGAALVLGLALVAALLGTLALGAHLLAPAAAGALMLGQRALVLGGGLTFIGLGLAVARGLGRSPDALASGAGPLAGLLFGATALAASLLWMLDAAGTPGSAARDETNGDNEMAVAASLGLLALAAGGYEAWVAVGSYQTPRTAALGAAALLGLAAVQPTRFATARRLAFLAALAYLAI
jgi:hypothetical protein